MIATVAQRSKDCSNSAAMLGIVPIFPECADDFFVRHVFFLVHTLYWRKCYANRETDGSAVLGVSPTKPVAPSIQVAFQSDFMREE